MEKRRVANHRSRCGDISVRFAQRVAFGRDAKIIDWISREQVFLHAE
jgi:hypothetical protein